VLEAVARLAGRRYQSPAGRPLCPPRSRRRIAGARRRSTGGGHLRPCCLLLLPKANRFTGRLHLPGTPATHSRSRSAGGRAIAMMIVRRSSRLPIAYPVSDGFGEAELKPDAVLGHRAWRDCGRLGRTSARPRNLEPSLSSLPTGLLTRFNVLRVRSNPCCRREGKSATGEMTEHLFATMETAAALSEAPAG
jgi:hypothetical protein